MLSADQFDALIQPITDLYADFETAVISDIARRLVNMDFDSAAWEAQRLNQSGALNQDILTRLSSLTGKSQKQVADMLSKAGYTAMKFDDKIYKDAGLKPMSLNMSPAMLDALKAGIQKTNGVVDNLTRTTALTGQQAFVKAANLAYLEISTGTMSYDQAVKLAIKSVAAQGLKTIDFAGHTDHLDVAMRRAALTGVSQTAGQLQMNRAGEMGSDLVAVSAHAGARNKGVGPANHESWQGKIYSLSGRKYPNFYKITGYGTGEGLGGWNCRHSFYPYFEGISENAYTSHERAQLNNRSVTYQGHKISLYDATQIQRAIERKIRFWKRQAEALQAAKIENNFELSKVSYYQAMMRDFIKQVNKGVSFIVDRNYEREQIQ